MTTLDSLFCPPVPKKNIVLHDSFVPRFCRTKWTLVRKKEPEAWGGRWKEARWVPGELASRMGCVQGMGLGCHSGRLHLSHMCACWRSPFLWVLQGTGISSFPAGLSHKTQPSCAAHKGERLSCAALWASHLPLLPTATGPWSLCERMGKAVSLSLPHLFIVASTPMSQWVLFMCVILIHPSYSS